MDSATYEIESRVEQTHWWFVGRRRLLKSMIAELGLAPDAAILDIGTSTGTNLRMLKEMGFIGYEGLELSDDAIRWCAEKDLGRVCKGDACRIPMPDQSYDLVLATDIVEHVDDDEKALREIRRVLKSSGRAILTVPAFPSLWGLQDIVAHHKRRYRRGEFEGKLRRTGLTIGQSFYFNCFLFAPIWLVRQIIRIFHIRLESENQLNNPLINEVLKRIFFADVYAAKRLPLPFGVSVLAVVRRD